MIGVGRTKKPKILIVSDYPPEVDDRTGQAFSSKAGQWLQKSCRRLDIIEHCYFTFLVKCYGIELKTVEIEACCKFVRSEIIHLQPKCIVFLGLQSTRIWGFTDSWPVGSQMHRSMHLWSGYVMYSKHPRIVADRPYIFNSLKWAKQWIAK